jgi:hypothetical protein
MKVTDRLRMAGWALLCAPMLLARGPGLDTLAWAAALLPIVLVPDRADPGPVSVLFLGAAALASDSVLMAVLTCSGALLLAWRSATAVPRACGLVSAGLCTVFLLSSGGGYRPTEPPAAQEVHLEGSSVWRNAGSLDGSNPSVRFRTGGWGTFSVSVDVGGVRDTCSVAVIRAGGTEVQLTAGLSSVEIPIEPGDGDVTVEMTRGWRPFEHPVVHFVTARFDGTAGP